MTFFWGSAYGFPKPLPTAPFKRYIKCHEIEASHFYSAYPEATTTMVLDALELKKKVDAFGARTAQATPEQFAAAWGQLLTETQAHL
jgi:hypothetical protein